MISFFIDVHVGFFCLFQQRVRQGHMVLIAMQPVDIAATHRNVYTKMDYV